VDNATWLGELGMQQYLQAFRDNAIDAALLPELTAEDLKDLGVSLVGHRRKLLAAIATLRRNSGTLTPAPADEAAAVFAAERRQITDILLPYRQLIVELVEKSRLPAMYPWREYVEAGGLIAYASDDRELWRRMANDVHEILNGAKPRDIPIYRPTKFEFLINLKAANTLGLTIPPAVLAAADEVIE
jgi:SAM domain (Sterile alpha motif)/ABC transporter substrate binding protein